MTLEVRIIAMRNPGYAPTTLKPAESPHATEQFKQATTKNTPQNDHGKKTRKLKIYTSSIGAPQMTEDEFDIYLYSSNEWLGSRGTNEWHQQDSAKNDCTE